MRTLDTRFNVLDHLEYLRLRLIRALLAYAAASVASYFAVPYLLPHLIPGEEAGLVGLVFLSPAEAFFSQVKLALALGLVVGLPFILYQLWALFEPAMNRRQRAWTLVLIPGAYALFVGGCLFAFALVLPLALRFFLGFGGEELQPEIAIGNYVSFLIGFVLPFGILFELPVVILVLARLGILDPRFLARNRKYAVFVIFVVAALLTPADAVSQLLMAGPLLVLFEGSLLLARLVAPKAARTGGGEGPPPRE